MNTLIQLGGILGIFIGWTAMLWARYRTEHNSGGGHSERGANVIGAALTLASTLVFLNAATQGEIIPSVTAFAVIGLTLFAATSTHRLLRAYDEAEAIIRRRGLG